MSEAVVIEFVRDDAWPAGARVEVASAAVASERYGDAVRIVSYADTSPYPDPDSDIGTPPAPPPQLNDPPVMPTEPDPDIGDPPTAPEEPDPDIGTPPEPPTDEGDDETVRDTDADRPTRTRGRG